VGGEDGLMGRRAKPQKGKADAKRALAGKTPKDEGAKVRDLEKRLAEALKLKGEALAQLQTRDRELVEAQEQQTATSEILNVIASSPTDTQPVFDAIVTSAVRLCRVDDGWIVLVEGDGLRAVSATGQLVAQMPIYNARGLGVSRASVIGRAIIDRATLHIPDLASESETDLPEALALQRILGHRTQLITPLMREGVAIGAILLARFEVRLFSDRQIELLKTFADQAVIAIENVRLFNETKEALEQRVATSEVLAVISRSPTDVQPVFETIAALARRLCNARECAVFRFDGELIHLVAQADTGAAWANALRSAFPRPPGRGSITARAIQTHSPVHVPDVLADPEYDLTEAARASGVRTTLSIPMIREGQVIGAITVDRGEREPFPEKQIELVTTFADQAVIAIENVRLFTELQASNREISRALDKQTATSDILRVISQSQTDVQPVFDAILTSAVRLLGAYGGFLTRIVGDQIELVAFKGPNEASEAGVRALFPQSLQSVGVTAYAIRDRVPLNIVDYEVDSRVSERARVTARLHGYRSWVTVPILRHADAVGTILIARRESGGFTDDEIALLQTFADQAVIAIENVRLFTELQENNEALTQAHAQVTEALEQQTATSEILRVISQSPTDVQPVFDTILRSAVRLCDGFYCALFLVEGEMLHFRGSHNIPSRALEELNRAYPTPVRDGSTGSARAVRDRRVVHTLDMQEDPEIPEGSRQRARGIGHRSWIGVPMLREGTAIGTIAVSRSEVKPFSEGEIALLKTFADQAVIAIENVRLFTELQEKNQALTAAHAQVSETLEQQTATAEILRVISRSQADARPVFEAIAENAMRLFRAWAVQVYRLDGLSLYLQAARGGRPGMELPEWAVEHGVGRASYRGRSILDRAIVHVRDVLSDPGATVRAREWARADGWRSVINAPMLRDSAPIGLITVYRLEPGGFLPTEVELLQTFAEQAVIAVENARLLAELQARTDDLTRSVDQLTALGEVGRAVSSSLDLETVLTTIVSRAVQLSGLEAGAIYEYDEVAEVFHLRATQNLPAEFLEIARPLALPKGEGATGRLAVTREPVQIPDMAAPDAYRGRMRDVLLRLGHRALLAVPLISEDHIVGGLVVNRRAPGEFAPEVIDLLRTFATQSALAIQNARLFREIDDKSRQLAAASQHKSEFLANMSHELRTPLNAIIGYSELLEEEAGDLDGGRLVPDLQKIATAAKHQLSLINDILDLSKVEAGRMELEITAFDLATAIDNALTLVRERASRRGIVLGRGIDEHLGTIRSDERKIKQVLLNLLSNALKFTPEGGRIDVRAAMNEGLAEISVADTGVGIAPEDQEAIFEEFRQVGTADKKVEGTGLGLALSRKFIELHGGRIWVKSQLGQGSTFTFTLPVRREK
jgi:GAF domain-containing protein